MGEEFYLKKLKKLEMSDRDDDRLRSGLESVIRKMKKAKAGNPPPMISNYPFQKKFYTEAEEIEKMSEQEVAAYRKELQVEVIGEDVPKPIKTWGQAGLASRVMRRIRKLNYEKPLPIQAQALPAIMSGRNCIGAAKTASGKTLAYFLPLLRHIKAHSPQRDGPIGLIMVPTGELVEQVHRDICEFAERMCVNCVAVSGGGSVSDGVLEIETGIAVCTPDIVSRTLPGERYSDLSRVTFLVLDGADQMLQMGLEKQVTRIVKKMRFDFQTVVFSATFPREVEAFARNVVYNPVEIYVGEQADAILTRGVDLRLPYSLLKRKWPCMEAYRTELEFNDFPDIARWKLTRKETLLAISVSIGVDITTMGQHVEAGRIPGPGVRKLYFFIQGPTQQSVDTAKAELQRLLQEHASSSSLPSSTI